MTIQDKKTQTTSAANTDCTVTKLPTAATSYYTVNKAGRYFDVVLVTPIDGMKPIKTRLYRFTDKDAAIQHGKDTADQLHRPFKMRGVAA